MPLFGFGGRSSKPTPRDQDDSSEDGDKDDASVTMRSGLKSMLLKMHRHHRNWGKRWMEYDDRLDVLYCFKSKTDSERRTPHHIYSAADLTSAAVHKSTAVAYCWQLDLVEPNEDSGEMEPASITFSASSNDLNEQWVQGIKSRIGSLKRNGTRSRHLRIKISRSAAKQADAEDCQGLILENLDWSPIGSRIVAVRKGSPADDAGLEENDIILAVNGEATLSHKHTSRLLSADGRKRRDLIVFSEQRREVPKYDDE